MIRVLLYCLPVFVIIGLGNCGILGGDDKEKPIVWEEEDINDYVIYAHSYVSDYLYIIDPSHGEYEIKNDFESIYSITSNANGSILYVSTGDENLTVENGNIYEVNTNNWESTVIYDRPVEFIHSSRKDIYFVTKAKLDTGRFADFLPERILGKINVEDGKVSELGSIKMAAANFHDYKAIQIHPNLPIAYLISNEIQLIEYNFESQQSRALIGGKSVSNHPNFTLSPNGRYMFFVGGPVYDTVREEIVGDTKVFKWGHAAVRSDNKEVYITDNGDLGIYNRPEIQNVNIYSLQSDSIIDTINVGGITGSIFLTPKERYAVLNKRDIELVIIDLKERKIEAQYDFTNEFTLTNIDRIYISTKQGEK
ncbi:MAG: hypothetical protein JJ895_01460 [Balneolaceae bacterium]|nr:hypothetical protein [Balneolaceae bacterium]